MIGDNIVDSTSTRPADVYDLRTAREMRGSIGRRGVSRDRVARTLETENVALARLVDRIRADIDDLRRHLDR
ncbi:hypothetical protein CCR97_18875 [Rhodoplanes elegans]|uniref:Uncharacterized protein n=1 Tax=Rhodoplanes elegans TaxID=29408 RepID=A0A327KW10_9BRAD|nr:hypothetical protein [Rhodoplanes elegans]RAI42276.1 hypothetical protein CH338_00560 [Rhodoplanes elegans]